MTSVHRAPVVLTALLLGCALLAPSATASATTEATTAADEARALLWRGVSASSRPHIGDVSIVTFDLGGPRIATVGVRVDSMGMVELRRPTRWVLGGPRGALVRSGADVAVLTPAGGTVGLDVDALLAHRTAWIGEPVELDTGPAVPVVLVRTTGAAVQETFHVDVATDVLVRRETRGADGRVLRVVAYTRLATVASPGPAPVGSAPRDTADELDTLSVGSADAAGALLPGELGGGFALAARGGSGDVASARYTDGLSVLSVYAEPGELALRAVESATVLHLAGRDVWTWPGSEPTRMVWTGGGQTWTAVTDAPLEVVEDALASLPGEHVPHDLGSRLVRGCLRVVDAVRQVTGI